MNIFFKKSYIVYTFIFLLYVVVTFSSNFLFGYTLVDHADAFRQHVAYVKTLHEYIYTYGLGFWNNWDWNHGVGSDAVSILSYYNLGDVLGWVNALLPIKHLDWTYSFFYLLRLYLVGAAAILYFSNHFKNTVAVVLASVTYTFSGMNIPALHPMFVNAMWLLPLILYGIDLIISGKNYAVFIITVAYSLMSNVYTTYIIGLGAIAYFLIELIFSEQENKIKIIVLGKTIFAGIISLLISMPFWVQSVRAILNSPRAGGVIANGLWLYPAKYYFNFVQGLFVLKSPGFYTNVAVNAVAFISLVVVFVFWKQNKKLVAALFIQLIMLMFPLVAAIMNGGTTPSNRWVIIFILTISYATAWMVENLETIFNHRLQVTVFVTIGIAFVAVVVALPISLSKGYALISMVSLVAASFVIAFPSKKRKNSLLFIAVFNIVGVGAFAYSETGGNLVNLYSQSRINDYHPFDVFKKTKAQRVSYASTDLTSSLNRANFAQFDHAMTLESYNSLDNKFVYDFSKSVVNTPTQKLDPLRQMDNREELLSLLGVNQIYSYSGNKRLPFVLYKNNGVSPLYTSKTSVPLVYRADNTISERQYYALPSWQRSSVLTNNTVVDEKKTGVVNTENEPVTLDTQHEGKFNFLNSQTVRVSLPNEVNNSGYQLMLYFEGLHFKAQTFAQAIHNVDATNEDVPSHSMGIGKVSARQKKFNELINWGNSDRTAYILKFTASNKYENSFIDYGQQQTTFYNPQEKVMINLGSSDAQRHFVDIKLNKKGILSFKKMKIVAVPMGNVKRSVEQIHKKNKDIDFKLSNKGLRTTINVASKKQFMATSIPYLESGWNLLIDGKPAKIVKTNVGFIGFALNKGNHLVELKYHTPYLRVTIVISLITITLLIIFGMVRVIRNR